MATPWNDARSDSDRFTTDAQRVPVLSVKKCDRPTCRFCGPKKEEK